MDTLRLSREIRPVAVLVLLLLLQGALISEAFTVPSVPVLPSPSRHTARVSVRSHREGMRRTGCRHHDKTIMALNGRVEDDDAGESVTRGDLFRKMATFTCCSSVVVGALGGGLAASAAAETASKTGARGEAAREWISGKGAQPKGSDDKTGTKKETKYLRCLSNCLATCQKPTDGPERDREECLQACQDECCTSYEQCTYPVSQNK